MKTIADLPLVSGRTWNGHAYEFRQNPMDLLVRAQKELMDNGHGDVGKLQFFHFPAVLLFSPELIHEALVEKAKHINKSLALKIMFYPMAGRGLFTSDGDLWRRQRKLMAPLFHPAAIRSYAGTMNEIITRCLDTWQDGEIIDAGREMTRLTMGVAAKTLFDANTLDESQDISDAIHAMFNYINGQTGSVSVVIRAMLAGTLMAKTDLSPSMAKVRDNIVETLHEPVPVPTPERLRLFRGLRLLNERMQRITEERRRTGVQRDDLLSRLLAARDEDDGSFMTDRQVRDEAMTLFVAGHETTATSTTWALYFMSRNPEVYRRWKEEVAGLGGDEPSPDNTPKLVWTRGIFREALRFYPPVFAFDRITVEDMELGGYSLPAFTPLIFPNIAIHRNPLLWPNPEQFDPGRYTPELEAKRPRGAYMPFGLGHRVCIGAMFAELEALLLFAQIAQRFEFEPVDSAPVEPDMQAVFRPKTPVRLRVRKIAK